MDFSAPRYTDISFPPYAFRPGVNTHPDAPDGHGVRLDEADASATVAAADWQGSRAYLYGCDLYNHGYFWEAHEAWEAIWQRLDKRSIQARFLQGLIQVSACALKTAIGNPRGAQRLLDRATRHLRAVTDEADGAIYMGLPLARFLADAQAYYAVRLAGHAAAVHDASAFPSLVLEAA